MITTSLERFCPEDLKYASKLLEAYSKQISPEGFEDSNVQVVLHEEGLIDLVCLKNDEEQMLVLDKDTNKLVMYYMIYSCGNCYSGTAKELRESYISDSNYYTNDEVVKKLMFLKIIDISDVKDNYHKELLRSY